jgi:hypothetical protein
MKVTESNYEALFSLTLVKYRLYIVIYHGANLEHLLKDIPALQESITGHDDMLAMSQSVFRLPPTPRSFKLVELDLTLK